MHITSGGQSLKYYYVINRIYEYITTEYINHTNPNPKNGIGMLNDARQAEKDSKQTIQKHSANSLSLEKCLELYFPDNNFSKETLIRMIKTVEDMEETLKTVEDMENTEKRL